MERRRVGERLHDLDCERTDDALRQRVSQPHGDRCVERAVQDLPLSKALSAGEAGQAIQGVGKVRALLEDMAVGQEQEAFTQ